MKSTLFATILRGRSFALTALALGAMVATTAHATTITVAAIPSSVSGQIATGYAPLTGSGWTNASGDVAGAAYNFIYANNTVATKTTTSGAANGGDGYVSMDEQTTADPDNTSGSFFALDGDFDEGALSTTLTGLTVGDTVSVTFDWAATQQLYASSDPNGPGCTECTGSSTDKLEVSLGSQTDDTSVLDVTDTSLDSDSGQGFSGWQDGVTLTFTATATSETLSFLDVGTPTDPQVPTFALLDNITASETAPATPEPSSLLLLGTGLAGLAGFVRSRFKKGEATVL